MHKYILLLVLSFVITYSDGTSQTIDAGSCNAGANEYRFYKSNSVFTSDGPILRVPMFNVRSVKEEV